MNSGLKQGKHQGIKNGNSLSNMQSGMKKGMHKNLSDKMHSQDPSLLKGIKRPLIFCIADFYTQPDGITTTMKDLCGSGFSLTCNAGGSYRPNPILRDIFNNKTSLDFQNTASFLIPSPTLNLGNYNATTFIFVLKLKNISTRAVYCIDDVTTPGGINLDIVTTLNTLRSTFRGGQAGSVTSSVYESYKSSAEMNDWMIITSKSRLGQPQGPGSEQELYVNGNLQKKFISSTFNVITTVYNTSQNIIIGNDNSTLSGTKGNGIKLGAVVVLPYWASETEQQRIENYFRWYYGNNF